MFSSLVALAARLAAIRWAIKSLIGLGVLVPLAFLLKVVGLPILAVLGVLAAPVMFVLFLFGLPIFLVLIVAAMLMGALFFMLSIGLIAFKLFVFVILPIWLVWKVTTFCWRMIRPAPPAPASAGSTNGI